MFGVVGALIVSRDRRNTIGFLFLWASFLTALSFLGGEVFTYAVTRGQSGWWVVAMGLLNNFGWLFGIFPVVFLTAAAVPRRTRPHATMAAVPVVQRDVRRGDRHRPRVGSEDADRLERIDLDREPVVHRGGRDAPERWIR